MTRHVHAIPEADRAFLYDALAALDWIDARTPIENVAAALADRLRPAYPDVVVHRQPREARILDIDVWYAYRDGPFGLPAKDR